MSKGAQKKLKIKQTVKCKVLTLYDFVQYKKRTSNPFYTFMPNTFNFAFAYATKRKYMFIFQEF